MKIEIWEAKEKKKVDVMIDSNGTGWVKKTDFDYVFKKYKSVVKTSCILLFEMGVMAIMFLYLLRL